MKFRYGVKPLEGSWLVYDKLDKSILAHFSSRRQARAHARGMNEAIQNASVAA